MSNDLMSSRAAFGTNVLEGPVETEANRRIDDFVETSRAMVGQRLGGGYRWNTLATSDVIRHFAFGTGDDNPLWIDEGYAGRGPHGQIIAPPAFLTSVLYPVRHGADIEAGLGSLVVEVAYEWSTHVRSGDRLDGYATLEDVTEGPPREGSRRIFVTSRTTYHDDGGSVLATARATTIRASSLNESTLVERPEAAPDEAQVAAVREALDMQIRSGERGPWGGDLHEGQAIRPAVRGPLTLADLVCWRSAAGPGFRAGRLAYLDTRTWPASAIRHPRTGWHVPGSIQHEDPDLAAQRGMPAPFDNGVMRFASVSPMVTDWMGDHGRLRSLAVNVERPNLLGDVTWLTGTITGKDSSGGETTVEVLIQGTNQLGEVTTRAEALVELPTKPASLSIVMPGMTRPPKTQTAVRVGGALGATALFDAVGPHVELNWRPAHDMIASQATQRPDAVAVRTAGDVLTFAQLEQNVCRMSHWLSGQGVRPGDVLGLVSDRSSRTMVALLAIQRLGAAYLPLDPRTPSERASKMLDGVNASLALSVGDTPVLGTWPGPGQERRILDLNVFADAIREASDRPVRARIDRDDTACIMFTSGSTGVGRAVPTTYGGISHYVDALAGRIPMTPDDVYLHSASLAFSASIRQWAFPLSVGATMVFASIDQRRDPLSLFSLVKQSGVTVWDTVPSMLRYCIAAANGWETRTKEAFRLTAVDKFILSGEPVYWSVIEAWRELMWRPATFFNLYGQAETTGSVCAHTIEADADIQAGLVPVGRPFGNIRVEIRSAEGADTAGVEETGELYVSGNRVAKQYLNAPEASATRFVVDDEGVNWCRTGDLARRVDGLIEVLGRADDSVNLGGIRIALGEVESALRSHPNVGDASVRPDKDGDEVRSLSAFAEPRNGAALSESALRAFAEEILPPHMVPRTIVIAPALPRNTSGKVDRKALSQLLDTDGRGTSEEGERIQRGPVEGSASDSARSDSYVAPRTELEVELAKAWARALSIERVGIDDPFPDFGGNSLIALQLTERIRRTLNVQVVLRDLFEAPTVRQLAERLEDGRSGQVGAVVSLQPKGSAPPLFCVGGIMGHPYHYLRLTDLIGSDQPCYGIEYPGVDGGREPLDRMDALAAFFVEQIKSVRPQGPYLLVGYSLGGRIVYEVARLLSAEGERVPLVLLLDSAASGYWDTVKAQNGEKRSGLLARAKRKVGRAVPGAGEGLVENHVPEPKPNDGASEHVRAVYRAAREADLNQDPRPYDGSLTLVRVEQSELERGMDPSYGWGALARGGVRIHYVKGEHLTLFLPGNVETMAEACRMAIQVARAEMAASP